MTGLWRLPTRVTVGEKEIAIHSDYRDILEIFSFLNDEALPSYIRWNMALQLFYAEEIPDEYTRQAIDAMSDFISGGTREAPPPGPPMLSWEQDAAAIVADVNKVAATEIRSLPYLHWWTFLSYFHAIGEGQLSTVVGIRHKLARGEKLTAWEQAFYREHRAQVEIRKKDSPEEQAQRRALTELLKRQDACRKGVTNRGQ